MPGPVGSARARTVPPEGRKPRAGSSAQRRASTAWPVRAMASWAKGSGSPHGHPQLPRDEVDPGDQLGDGVLDLEAGVHLHEAVPGRVVARDDELDRPGAGVAAGAGGLDGGLAHRGPGRLVQQDARRLLDDLLVAALERALALAEVDDVAVAVGEHLDLDVPGPVDPPLHQEGVVAEGGAGLAPGGGDLLGERRLLADQPHPLAAAARRGLQQDGHADLAGGGGQLGVGQAAARGAGDDRDPGRAHRLLGADLVAHQRDGVGGRPDEDQPLLGAGPREGGVLGEEAVPGVDRLGAGAAGRLQQAGDVQVALGGGRRADPYGRVGLADVPGVGVGVAVHRDRAHPSSRRVRMTRTAISPRLATSTVSNMVLAPPAAAGALRAAWSVAMPLTSGRRRSPGPRSRARGPAPGRRRSGPGRRRGGSPAGR